MGKNIGKYQVVKTLSELMADFPAPVPLTPAMLREDGFQLICQGNIGTTSFFRRRWQQTLKRDLAIEMHRDERPHRYTPLSPAHYSGEDYDAYRLATDSASYDEQPLKSTGFVRVFATKLDHHATDPMATRFGIKSLMIGVTYMAATPAHYEFLKDWYQDTAELVATAQHSENSFLKKQATKNLMERSFLQELEERQNFGRTQLDAAIFEKVAYGFGSKTALTNQPAPERPAPTAAPTPTNSNVIPFRRR